MSKWPLWGGLIALVITLGRFLYRFLYTFGTIVEKLLIIGTFIVLLSHILSHAGAPIPDLLPFLPAIGSSPGN